MADFRIKLGVDVETKDISSTLNSYKAKPIEVKFKPDISSIDSKIRGYKAPKQIEVTAKLNSKKIDEKIRNYTAPKQIEVTAKLSTKDITKTIEAYNAKTPIKVDVKLNTENINSQISGHKVTEQIVVDAKLNDDAIGRAIKGYVPSQSIKVDVDPDFTNASKKISGYQMRNMLKVNVKLNKTAIDSQIKNFQTSKHIEVGAKLRDNAIESAITKYTAKELVPVTIDFKAGEGKEVSQKISEYKNTPVEVPVKLKPAAKGFDSSITKKPVQVEAELKTNAINNAIENHKTSSKIPVDVKLQPKDINAEITGLKSLVTEPLKVDVKLNDENINADIALFQPTATLGIKPDLIVEDIDDQIKAYVPKAQIKVNVKLDDDNIDEKTGKQNLQSPIQVNVKLDRDNINEQIKGFKTNAKVKVGVKLDFASHKDDTGKEIQKGVSKQLKEFETKSKIKVGVELDRDGIAQEVNNINIDTPIRLGVELDPNGVQNVQNQVDNIRQQLEALGNVNINIGGNGGGAGNGRGRNSRGRGGRGGAGGNGNGAGNDGGNNGGAGGGQINETTEAYRRLMRVLRELGSIRKQLSGLDTLENPDLANTLTAQIQTLEQQYNNLMDSIRARQIQFTADQQSQMRTLIDSTNRKIEANQSKAEDNFVSENRERAYDRLLSTLEQIHSLEQNIAKLRDQGGNTNQITELENQLNNLMTTYQNLMETMQTNLTPEQWGSLDSEIDNAEHEMSLLQAKFEDARNKLAEGIGEKLGQLDFDAEAQKINSDFGRLSTQSDAARDSVNGLNQALADMKTAYNDGNVEALIEANERYVQYAKTAKNQIAMQQRDEKDFADTYKDDVAELEAVADKIDKIKTRIAKLDVKSNSNEIDFLTRDLQELEAAYQRLYTKLQGKIPTDQLSALGESAIETAQKLELIERQLKDAKENLAAKINIKLNDGTFDNDISNIISKFKKLRGSSDEIRTAMNEVNAALSRMKIASGSGDIDGLIKANQEYEIALKAVKNQLDINTRAEKDNAAAQKLSDQRNEFMSSIDAWLTKNSAAVDRFGAAMLDLKAKAENCDKVTLDHLKTQFKQLDAEADAAGLKMQSFGDRIKAQFKKYSAYFGVAELFMYAEQGLRDMFQQVVAIDTAMTELKKVTNETDASYDQFLSNAANRAKEIGTTIDGLVASTADFARLGYSFEESAGLAEVANIYTVVGDEIDGVEDATQSLVSTLAAFKHEMGDMSDSDFAMSIVDKMNEVSNNFAISSGGIGEALQRSASSMAAANNTLDETIAMITAAM